MARASVTRSPRSTPSTYSCFASLRRDRRRDHLRPAVMPVLAHFRDQDARTPAFGFGELVSHGFRLNEVLAHFAFRRVYARNGADRGVVPAPNLLERVRNLAQRRPFP